MYYLFRRLTAVVVLVVLFTRAHAQQTLPSWALGPFIRPEPHRPVIAPDSTSFFDCPMQQRPVAWESNDTFNPAAVVYNDSIVMLYRAEDKSGIGIGQRTSRIGIATSTDGVHMHRDKKPVLFPANDAQKAMEWKGGCEDPRVAVTPDGTYLMLYTQWNNRVPRLAAATSKDLRHWTKHGPVFAKAWNGRFKDEPTKSASVLTQLDKGRLVMVQVNHRYWMYWGEHAVYAATSTDLVNWEPLLDEKGNLKKLMLPRKGYFDSDLTECGPPAVLTPQGIVLVYNGKNAGNENRAPAYTPNVYCAGQALFDRNDPTHFLQRLDKPFFVPEAAFEKSGQYPAGTVFMEGLVYYHDTWMLYYGCADSRVGVAMYKP
jgi:predicted GH43/DUF377 family glycosyl hydrolase